MDKDILKKLNLEYLLEEDILKDMENDNVFQILAVSSTSGKSKSLYDLDWLPEFLKD